MDSGPTPQPRPQLRVPSASIAPHLGLYIVQALASPPSRRRNHTFAVVVICLGVYAHTHPHFTNDVGVAQPFTVA
ncbi:hypothetical protein F5X98DRAFT_333924 [Xylaria grammica]|nr:hypothetical protein F5X98DRAFT_333924 [Xylaria grammica]